MRRICLVSEECNGVSNGGGIGACVRGLAELWSSAGFTVDLLITKLKHPTKAAVGGNLHFVNQVFFLDSVAAEDKVVFPPVDEPSKSYCVYRFLRDRDYGEVHFNDWLGTGFYTAMARRQGLFDAMVVTHLHGSSEWVRSYNLNPPELEDLEIEALERSQIENSDLVISPSHYLLDWYSQRGVKLPQKLQRQWVLPQWHDPRSRAQNAARNAPLRARSIEPGVVKQVIYFGRHERRKGFDLFVDAISKLPDEMQPDIVFVGRFDRIARENTGAMAMRKLSYYAGSLRFFDDLSQKEALDLLRLSVGAICVMPSRIENSPCVVGECFTLGIPFLTTDVGGVAELIDERSRPHCLVRATAADLSQAIVRVMNEGMPSLTSTLSPPEIFAQWLEPLPAPVAMKSEPETAPLVSVCFTHYERPNLLRRAVESILAQTYSNIEIIIVDDGSRSAGAHAYLDEIEASTARFPVKIIRTDNRYLGAARNQAALHAKGEFLLFHDDDNFAESREVEMFIRAATLYGADILTAQCYVFHDGEVDKDGLRKRIEYYPFGIGGVFSFFRNRFGDANALVRRSAFEELGGFTEERGVGWEDWEFFLKAYLKNYRMGIVPEPLFNYRASGTGMLGTGDPVLNHERLYAAVDKCRPGVGSDLLRYATRHQVATQTLDRTWDLLSRERAGALHQKLTSVEPNSREAIVLLSELAFEIGRFEDAVAIGARIFEQREKLAVLLQNSSSVGRTSRRPFELFVVPPEKGFDAVLIEGWMVSDKGLPIDPNRILINGRWFNVAKIARMDRPDVQKALDLAADVAVGFLLYAISPGASSASDGRGAKRDSGAANGGWPSLAKLTGGRLAGGLSQSGFVFDDITANLPAVRGCRGHIDHAGWRREVEVAASPDHQSHIRLEIETAVAAETAVIWGDGEIDFGSRVSGSRSKYVRSDPKTGVAGPIKAVVPTNVRTHIVLT